MALLFVVVLSTIAGTAFRIIQNRYRQFHQSASWEEALLAAESGIDLAMAELRLTISDPTTAWAGWSDRDGNASADPASEPIFNSSPIILRTTEGGDRSWADVSVDVPSTLLDPNGDHWYRVRAWGTCEVSGGSVVVGEDADLSLRKLDFRRDRRLDFPDPHPNLTENVLHPKATRLVEAIVKPVGAFQMALLGVDHVNMNNHNIVVDSYDSRDDTKSTNAWYDENKRQENGDVGTNGEVIDAGNAHIYGDTYYNDDPSTPDGGVSGDGNVTGEAHDDFYREILSVIPPNETPESGSPTSVNGATDLAAGIGTPTNYRLSTINLSGNGAILHITGAEDGSPTYAQIVVTGDIKLSGQGQIVLDPGVYVRLFFEGDADLTGNGVANPNSPLHLQLYGASREHDANDEPISPGDLKISGNGGFRGAVYAPDYNIEMNGGGNSDSIYGSFVGWTINMVGGQAVHYDEALADGGLITDYSVISWFEDVR
jgi:hypothetical protein